MSSQRPLPTAPQNAAPEPPARGGEAPLPAAAKRPCPRAPGGPLGQWRARLLSWLRQADPVLKKKACVISAWLALSLFAALITFAPYCGEGGLAATARLRIQQVQSLQRPITAFYLENTGSQLWDEVALTLNGRYQLLVPSVAPGKNAVAQLDKFRDGELPAPDDVPLDTLRLDCTAGSITFDLRTGKPLGE